MSAHANSPADRAGSLWLPFLISIGIAVFLITLMPTVMFWDRDEAFYARAAVEMLQSATGFCRPIMMRCFPTSRR